jgi:hypothetical protein
MVVCLLMPSCEKRSGRARWQGPMAGDLFIASTKILPCDLNEPGRALPRSRAVGRRAQELDVSPVRFFFGQGDSFSPVDHAENPTPSWSSLSHPSLLPLKDGVNAWELEARTGPAMKIFRAQDSRSLLSAFRPSHSAFR